MSGDCVSTSALQLLKIRQNVISLTLDYCFRLHPDLLSFPNDTFYNNCLKPAVTHSDRSLLAGCFPFPYKHCPLLFCSLHSTDKLALGSSRVNIAEIDATVIFIHYLLTSCKLVPSQIAVLTFYGGQRVAMSERILNQFGEEMAARVFVVDSFQGKQVDVTILSVVRASSDNSEPTIGFLHCKERLNVALTRSKHGLIIIGNGDTLVMASELWEALLYYLGEWGLVQSDFHLKLANYFQNSPNTWYNGDTNRLIGIDNGLYTST